MRKLTQEKPKMLILIPLIIIILLGGLTMIGCSPDPKKTMMSYMEKKYGEEFTFVNIGTQLWDRPYVEMILTNDKIPRGKYIRVHMDKETKEMSDNYICYLMQDQMNEYLSKLAEPIYGPNQVFSMIPTKSPVYLSEEVGKGIAIEEYAKHMKHKGDYSFYVAKDEATRDEDLEEFRAALEAKECAMSFSLTYLKNASVIGQITETNITNSIWSEENKKNYGYFVMKNDYQFSRDIDWREIQ